MSKPTLAQRHVLKALQNRAVELAAMIDTANQHIADTGQRPPWQWFDDYHDRAIAHDALEKAAYAAGVPRAWIDHVREQGGNGITWHANRLLRAAEPLDLDRVLGGFTADVQLLLDWTVVDIAHRMISPAPPPFVAGYLDRNLGALRARTNGIANLLGLDAELGEQLWGTAADWAPAGARMVMKRSGDTVTDPWKNATDIASRGYALQAAALGAAGIITDCAEALPSAENLAAAVSRLLPRVQRLFPVAAGAAIESAVTDAQPGATAGGVVETATGSSLFSEISEVQTRSYGGELDWEVSAPQFSSAAEWFEP
ncbi:hypothetical protein ACIA8C_09910 [Nocardia sp. NPDC051321]|uniref:hypothetical protein n=1 Tax=Nocardia sp. NPDC051321 TaxID=3364323 RepID=UPI0037B0BC5D